MTATTTAADLDPDATVAAHVHVPGGLLPAVQAMHAHRVYIHADDAQRLAFAFNLSAPKSSDGPDSAPAYADQPFPVGGRKS